MKKDKLYIVHVLEAIEKIEKYTKGLNKGQFLSKDNEIVQDAVIRELQVIGEAVKSFSEGIKEQNLSLPWRDIEGMRNKLIHEYFRVDLKVVWGTIQKDLPMLKKAMNELVEL